jgi:hypothetical protein
MLAKELPYLVLMAKHAANTAKEIERRLPIASELRVFGILMITPLVSFKSNHCCGDTLCGCEVDSDSGYVCWGDRFKYSTAAQLAAYHFQSLAL